MITSEEKHTACPAKATPKREMTLLRWDDTSASSVRIFYPPQVDKSVIIPVKTLYIQE